MVLVNKIINYIHVLYYNVDILFGYQNNYKHYKLINIIYTYISIE